MKLEITFTTVPELKKQLVEIMEAFEPVQQYTLPIQDTSSISVPPIVTDEAVITPDPVVKAEDIEEVEAPKRTRKTKADRQKELAKPKVQEPIHVPNEDEVDPLDEAPSNFYSPIEFKLGFPKIISHLIDTKALTHQNLADYSKMYEVKFILEMTKHPQKLDAFYKNLVADKVIVEKGDY